MRLLESEFEVRGRGFLRSLPRHSLTATTLCATTIGAVSGAAAQTAPAPDQLADASSEKIDVTGLRPLINDKLPTGLQDAPQSLTVVSEQVMKDQAISRLQDALKNVPGITLNAGEGAARGDTVNLRGFSAFNDFFLDGIRDAAVYTRDSFDLESVEVLKGPSAVLFGRGSTGGVINQVSKAPTLTPDDSATLVVGTNAEVRATTDLDYAFGPAEALRLNAMDEHSETTDRDHVLNRRWGIAPSVSFGIGEPTSLTFSYLHQEENNVPDTGIPFVNGQPAPVSRNAFFGLTSDRNTTDDDIATIRLKHDFDQNLSIADTVRYANYLFDYHNSAPNFGNTPPGATTPLSQIVVGRDDPASSGTQTNFTNQTDVTARFETGPWLSHILVAGVEYSRQTSDLSRYTNPFNTNNNWVPETPLLDPNANETLPRIEPISSHQNTTAISEAVYLTDTIHVGSYVDLIGGFRYDRFSASFDQFTVASGANLHLDRVDDEPSPRAAIVVKPTDTQSYYFSYGTSFDPSAEALALTTKTVGLGPVTAKSYEVGAKTSWLDNQLNVTAALFKTTVDNAQTNDPDEPTVTILAGNQNVDGLEIGVSGYLTKEWEVFAGYTYLDAKTTASGTAADVGKFLPNTARNALNLWSTYELTDDWTVGGGGNWLGHRFADMGEQANLPGYVVWNAMVSYKVTKDLSLQLNGNNLFDKLYYDSAYYTSASENHVIPGPGRTILLTTNFDF
jgi:catecholate siderophore receptor